MQRWPSMLDNFETYKNDYTSVAEYCREYFEEQNINFEEAKKYRTIRIKVRDRLITYEGEELQLPNKIKKNVANLRQSVSENSLPTPTIIYEKNHIRFAFEMTPYALIYSYTGKIPTDWGNSQKSDIFVKRIDRHWYHITPKDK